MSVNTDHLSRCIPTLENSLFRLSTSDPNSIDYEVFRNAVIKSFELTLETAGKLLRKALKQYMASSRDVDALTYKAVFRHALKHSLVSEPAVTRWFLYRDNRNDTAYDHGIEFTKTTLKLLPAFLQDAKQLQTVRRAFLDSNLPIVVDILYWNDIPPHFQTEIEKIHEVLLS